MATLAALELKRPFGILAHQVLGPPNSGGVSWVSIGELLQLAAVLAAIAVHRGTGLPAAPWLEKLLGIGRAGRRPRLWVPALLTTLGILLLTAVISIGAAHFGLTSKLGSQLQTPSLPRPILVKIALLYPLAAIGAAISEEMVYRFALISIFVWLILLITPKAKERSLLRFWLPIFVCGFYFGYVHVAENIEALRTGNLAFDLILAPQTWAGIAFGYLFCTYGLEAAMLAHVTTDLLAPLALIGAKLVSQQLGIG